MVDAGNTEGIQYNIVDITLNGGLGEVTTKNQLLETPVTEKLTAVSHANGSDIWVMTRRLNSNDFAAYLVSSTGLNTTPVVSSIPAADNDFQGVSGYLKFSPDGRSIASVSSNGVQLFSFDNNTGVVGNFIDLRPYYSPLPHTNFFVYAYGVEFSPDSSKLYVSGSIYANSNVRHVLHQFDLTNSDSASIISSGTLLGEQPIQMLALQAAIDGKIYVAQYEESYLGVIDNPNVLGVGCGYNDNGINLGSGECQLGLPPFITSYFIVGLQAINFCFGDATEFTVNSNGPVTSIIWDFGDGSTSTLENPSHTYASPGNYTISVTANTVSESKTESKEITIYKIPVANPVTDIEICSTVQTYQFDLSVKDAEILGAQSVAENTIQYYSSLSDAQNGTNSLPLLYTNTDPRETIIARISNLNNPSCYNTTMFNLLIKEAPKENTVDDWIVCDSDLDGFYDFDLTQKDAEILNAQSSTTFSVSYFETQIDADSNINAVTSNYTNTSSSQQIFFRVENINYSECFETGSFFIEVIKQVLANEPSDYLVCDDDNDGFSTFDLTTKYSEILNGVNDFEVKITFHTTPTDMDNGINPVDAPSFNNTSPYNQQLYFRVESKSNPECYTTDQLELVVMDSPLPQEVSDWQVCDDDNDGIHAFNLTTRDSDVLGSQSAGQFTISYHETEADAIAHQNPITGDFQNFANPQTIFYRIENNTNNICFLTDSLVLEIFHTPTANAPSDMVVCDTEGTGIQTFDLSNKDAEVLNDQDANMYTISYFANQSDADGNYDALSKTGYINSVLRETLYVRIQNKSMKSCYDTTRFELMVNSLPQPNVKETYVICPDSPELIIHGGDFETWLWKYDNGQEVSRDRTLNVADLGEYSLTVTQTTNGVICENTVPFDVVSSGAPEDFTTEIGSPSDKVTITVNATGNGEFEYSTDGDNFQDSNRLEVFPGVHTIYVRDKFLCRTISEEVIALGYQKFFTPNNDGLHENWNIIGAANYPESKLYIYDRYGKFLGQFSPKGPGWDGTYNGSQLPSSDYWFRYIFAEGKVLTGHFSLKR